MIISNKQEIIIGSRASALAVRQAEMAGATILEVKPQIKLVYEKIITSGDKILDKPLWNSGGKGLFIKEVEDALLEGRIDLAVHSYKDMPVLAHEDLIIAAVLPRDNPADCFISTRYKSIGNMPGGARIGTSSLRRAALLQEIRPDLQTADLRGNINTRLRRLDEGEFDGIILASAGLFRLGLDERITEILDTNSFIPAPAQGAVALQCRKNDTKTLELLNNINCPATMQAVTLERKVLEAVDASCATPLAVHAVINGADVLICAMLASSDITTRIFVTETVPMHSAPQECSAIGRKLTENLNRL